MCLAAAQHAGCAKHVAAGRPQLRKKFASCCVSQRELSCLLYEPGARSGSLLQAAGRCTGSQSGAVADPGCAADYAPLQVVADNATQQLLKMRRQDQQRAMQRLAEDPGLSQLQLVQGPLLDLEVRGLPALQYFGSVVWK